ncbi:unnamed protein product [Protopolystoma xenopodis]|uniref:Uncharacterized protein n=1 Tax=Protopolystoma xenopodis TaxID=117903 RepID=A0A3S5A144_9PLAT|nr:unnamed protein product [Protopolystoma xenopodis]
MLIWPLEEARSSRQCQSHPSNGLQPSSPVPTNPPNACTDSNTKQSDWGCGFLGPHSAYGPPENMFFHEGLPVGQPTRWLGGYDNGASEAEQHPDWSKRLG